MQRSLIAVLVTLSVNAPRGNSESYFVPQLKKGERYVDIYSKSIAVTGDGYEAIVRRFGGSSAYLVTDPSPSGPRFDETDIIDGRSPAHGHLETRDGGNTNCYNGSCYPNRQTSGLLFIPLLWGTPPSKIHVGQTWTIRVDQAWEIGPAGVERVRVVSLDPTNHIAILQRDGRGTGASQDDERGLPITVNGMSGHASVEAGPSHWTGQIIIREGIVLSDEILIERKVTLKSEFGTFSGEERVFTILSAAPVVDEMAQRQAAAQQR